MMWLCLLILVIVNQSYCFNSIAGKNILVRQKRISQQGDIKYDLKHKYLCPNNYWGPQCSYHTSIYCYIKSLNQLNDINKENIKQEMQFELIFNIQCWLDHHKNIMGMIQLNQYLSQFNQSNQFGVRQQFGQNYQIVWANTSGIFDNHNQLKALKQNPNLTQKQILNIMIGNNTQFYETPFKYNSQFLGFGLINGNVNYQLNAVDPIHGIKSYSNFTTDQVQVSGLQQYVKSAYLKQSMQLQANDNIKNLIDQFRNGKDYQSIIQKQKQTFQGKQIDPRQIIQKPYQILPKIKIKVKLNPYKLTSYGGIRLQLELKQTYQQNLTHTLSMNSIDWKIKVKDIDIGVPSEINKNITITDKSIKSYYRVILYTVIALIVFFTLKYGHKKYQQYKAKQYSEFNEQNDKNVTKINSQQLHDEFSLKSSTTSGYSNQGMVDDYSRNSVKTNIKPIMLTQK